MAMRSKNRQVAWDKTNGLCFYCGAHLIPDDFRIMTSATYVELRACGMRPMQLDHALSRARGGTDDPSNLYPCCDLCNPAKSDQTIDEYRHRLAFKTGDLNFHFPFEEPQKPRRDYLMVASPPFLGALIVHNRPSPPS